MPCNSDYMDDSAIQRRANLDRTTRVACELLHVLSDLTKDYKQALSKDARKWCIEHEAADRKRKADEKAKERETWIRDKAIAKLTKAERRVLGVKE